MHAVERAYDCSVVAGPAQDGTRLLVLEGSAAGGEGGGVRRDLGVRDGVSRPSSLSSTRTARRSGSGQLDSRKSNRILCRLNERSRQRLETKEQMGCSQGNSAGYGDEVLTITRVAAGGVILG